MPSAKKTPNIGLNNWEGNEYVKRQDFVDDNLKIDKKVGEIDSQLGDMTQVPTTSKTASGAITELFTDVDNGKNAISGAITDVDSSVVIPTNPTFEDLASAIGNISTGKKFACGTKTALVSGRLIVDGLTFKPKMIIWGTTGDGYYVGFYNDYEGNDTNSNSKYVSGYVNRQSNYYPSTVAKSDVVRSNTGFSIQVQPSGYSYDWWAFE